MIRRLCGRLFRIVLGLVVVLVVLISLLIWRLAEKPISLNLLTPYIETVLPSSLSGLQMDVQDVVLAWHRQAKRIALSARGVHLRDTHGTVDATLPAVNVTLNLPKLLRQRVVALNKVYIDGAQVHVQHGSRETRDGLPAAQPALAVPTAQSVIDALETAIAGRETDPLLADLRVVHLSNSAITLQTPSFTRPLHIPTLSLDLRRTGNDIRSELSLSTSFPDVKANTTLALNASYERTTHQLTLESQFENLRPSALAALAPALSGLTGISISFQGSLKLALNRQTTWPTGDFDIQGSAGRFTLPGLYPKPQLITQFAANGHLDGASETLKLETAALGLGSGKHGKPRVHLKGILKGLRRPTLIDGRVTLKALSLADLGIYWPPDIKPQTRQWITKNIPSGRVNQAKAHLILKASKTHQLVVQDINGTMQYERLRVHFLRPLPPVRAINGQGRFNRSGFQFQIENGTLEDMALTGGEVDLTGLDRRKDAIAIRVGLTGPLQKALTLLNHPRLNLMSGRDMPLDTAAGQFRVETGIAFSLRQSIELKDIDVNVQGTLQNVSLQDAVLNQHLSNGQLQIDLDKHRMTLAGQAELAAIPLSFTWHEAFMSNKQNPDDWRIQMHAAIPQAGHAGRARLGYDLPGVIEGPMAAVIDAQIGWDHKQTVHLQFDLHGTTLKLPWLSWQKPAGERASASGKLQVVGNRAVAITDIHLETDTLKAHGAAQFDAAGANLVRFDIPHVTLGSSDLRDVVFQRLNPGLAITVGDGILDAAPLLHQQRLAVQQTADNTDGTPQTDTLPLELNLPQLHQVHIAPGRYLQNVQAHLGWDHKGWRAVKASGRIPVQGKSAAATQPFHFHYLPASKEQPTLSLRTNDLGALLRALNIYDNLIGGDITVTGQTSDAGAGIKTRLKATELTVTQAPVFAHVLAAASLQGLANLLDSDGLKFDNLDADMTLRGQQLKIAQAQAHGGSLGLTAKGNITYADSKLDLRGTIIPAYLMNSFLGQVPVVNLLVGGKGQGLVAINYHLTGPLADPQVSINPISALTPGFLRGIFNIFQQNKGEDEPPPSPKQAPTLENQVTEP